MQDLQMLQDAARVVLVASTRHHHARSLKYYPRRPCALSFVKSRALRPLQTHFLLFQQIFFVVVCIQPGTPGVPPRVLASGPKPCGATNILCPCMYTTRGLLGCVLGFRPLGNDLWIGYGFAAILVINRVSIFAL